MTIQASDPDAGDDSKLVYSLATGDISSFGVDPSSGLVYVVSAVGLSGLQTVEVIATDPRELNATTKVEVSVVCGESTSVVRSNIKTPTN